MSASSPAISAAWPVLALLPDADPLFTLPSPDDPSPEPSPAASAAASSTGVFSFTRFDVFSGSALPSQPSS